MGGSASEAWLNPLSGSGLRKEYALAREAVQNSCDAELEGETVLVRFRLRSVGGAELQELSEGLGLKEGPLPRLETLGLSERNAIEILGQGKGSQKTNVLYIEDFNTCGLGGKLEGRVDANDHFRRLCLWLGLQESAVGHEDRAGSFGYGKSVYANASNARTVAFYSYQCGRITPQEAREGARQLHRSIANRRGFVPD
jgi:hypothetical protein